MFAQILSPGKIDKWRGSISNHGETTTLATGITLVKKKNNNNIVCRAFSNFQIHDCVE